MTETVRPTKKQRDILTYIEQFIVEHGYSPSYREIMNGLDYTSVATVSLHINSLIRHGHLRKRDRSARSLEVTDSSHSDAPSAASDQPKPNHQKWLIDSVDARFAAAEKSASQTAKEAIDDLALLLQALQLLQLEATAHNFEARLTALRTNQLGQASQPSVSATETNADYQAEE